MTIQIAVITPTKNRKQYLSRCIESVMAQTYCNFEHFIVDDNSTDGTWQFLQQISKRYSHIKIMQMKKAGIGGARGRNLAINQTRARFITYLDDDDAFYSDHLQTLVKHFEQHQGCQFAYCAAHKTEDAVHVSAVWKTNIWDEDIRAVNLFPICAVMHTKKAWLDVGGMDESIGVYEDWDLWQRMIHYGYVPCFINRVTSIVDASLKDSIQHSESPIRKQQVGQIIAAKMCNREADYHKYLNQCKKLGMNVETSTKSKCTHKDRIKATGNRLITDDKRAWFWRAIK